MRQLQVRELFRQTQGIVTNASAETDMLNAFEDLVNGIPGKNGEIVKPPIGYYLYDYNEELARVIVFQTPSRKEVLVSTKSGKLYKNCMGTETPTELTFPDQTHTIGQRSDWASGDYTVGSEVLVANSVTDSVMLRCTVAGTTGGVEPTVDMGTLDYGDTLVDGTVTWRVVAYSPNCSTVIVDHFVHNGRLFLVTGQLVSYLYENGELHLWGCFHPRGTITAETWDESGWAAQEYTEGQVIQENGYIWRALNSGTPSVEPTWPTDPDIGDEQADDVITWRCEKINTSGIKYGGYAWAITYHDGYSESNPIFPTQVAKYKQHVKLSFPTGPALITQIRLYRYIQSANAYIFIVGFDKEQLSIDDDITMEYVDDTPNRELFGMSELAFDNDLPPAMSICEMRKGFVFMMRGSSLMFSKQNDPFHFPYNNEYYVGGDDGDEGVALVAIPNALLIFKQYRRYLLSGDDERSFFVRLSGYDGTLSKDSVQKIGDGVYYLSSDGFYVTDGATSQRLSGPIDDFFNARDFNTLRHTTSLYSRAIRHIYWNVPDLTGDSAETDGITFMMDVEDRRWSRINMGITNGGWMGMDSYFVLNDILYKIENVGYPNWDTTMITKWLRLDSSADLSLVDAIYVTASGGTGTLKLYYRMNFADDWTLLHTFTLTSSQDTYRIRSVLRGNYFQFKLIHSGKFTTFNALGLEYYRVRQQIREV